MVGPRKSSKTLSKAKLVPNKGHGHSLVDPSASLQLSESWWNHYIWEVCSANVWNTPKPATPVAGISQQKRVNCLWQCLTKHQITNASKIEWIGLQSFAPSFVFTWPLANQLPLLQASQQFFCRESASTMSRKQKMPFQEFLESQGADFYTTGINKLISHLQKCVDCNGSYFDS